MLEFLDFEDFHFQKFNINQNKIIMKLGVCSWYHWKALYECHQGGGVSRLMVQELLNYCEFCC